MAETAELLRIEAAGNCFAVADGFADAAPEDPGRLAVALGRDRLVDGLLLLLPPRADGDCRMVLHNADGSRAEACGNGLRCVGKLAVERGRASGPLVRIETDAGLRTVEVLYESGAIVAARATMGEPRVEALEEPLRAGWREVAASVIRLGNPHCVLFVPDVETVPVEELGPELARQARFPEGTNVEFVEVEPGGLRVRTWERGVGETASCGTGVSAAAVAAIELGRASPPVEVKTRGGRLRVLWEGGVVRLEGPVGVTELLGA